MRQRYKIKQYDASFFDIKTTKIEKYLENICVPGTFQLKSKYFSNSSLKAPSRNDVFALRSL